MNRIDATKTRRAPSTPPRPPRTRAPGRAAPRELDPGLLLAAQRGDRGGQRALVARYERPVRAIVARVLRGRAGDDLVDDLAQDTFLRVFRALTTFDPEGGARLSTWILTIATRRAIDELRRLQRAAQGLDDDLYLAGDLHADADAERARIADRLAGALADIAPEYRAAFVLRERDGLSYGEIADHLGIDLGTVKSRLSRARAGLRVALAELAA